MNFLSSPFHDLLQTRYNMSKKWLSKSNCPQTPIKTDLLQYLHTCNTYTSAVTAVQYF